MIKFKAIFLESAKEFLDSLDEKAREKVLYNIWKAREVNDPELFKKLLDEIWEFRTKYSGKEIRLLAFWDKDESTNTLVIATHGFLKKQQKTPKNEIERAKQLRNDYFNFKNKKQ
ncbi:MAG: type II toxin-antitoxin system RelE/ParE family toxin [Bacteroidales bacterium]|nr:type II toxin-antitoxin system RelE/ParE family toxin [Bacteroidales bacterium]